MIPPPLQPESLDMNSALESSLMLPADLFFQEDSEEPSDTNPATGYMVLPGLSTQPSLLPLPQPPFPTWSIISQCSRMGPGVSQLFILKFTIDHKTFFSPFATHNTQVLAKKAFPYKSNCLPQRPQKCSWQFKAVQPLFFLSLHFCYNNPTPRAAQRTGSPCCCVNSGDRIAAERTAEEQCNTQVHLKLVTLQHRTWTISHPHLEFANCPYN